MSATIAACTFFDVIISDDCKDIRYCAIAMSSRSATGGDGKN